MTNSPDVLLRDDASLPPAGESLAAMAESFAALRDETEGVSKYLSIFIDEAEITLDQMTEGLMVIGEGIETEKVEQLLIDVHRLKGSAASIGLHRAAKLAHLMEDALQEAVINREVLSVPVCSTLLACTDGLREYVQSLKSGRPKTEDFPRLAQALLKAQQNRSSPAAVQSVSPGLAGSVERTVEQVGFHALNGRGKRQSSLEGQLSVLRNLVYDVTPQADRENTYLGRVAFQAGLPLTGLKGRLVYEKLSHVGEIQFFDPPPEQLEELETLDCVWFGVTSEMPFAKIRRVVNVAGITDFLLEPLLLERHEENAACRLAAVGMAEKIAANLRHEATPSAGLQMRGAVPSAAGSSGTLRAKPAETMRVEVRRLDGLMDLVGQLVTEKGRFLQVRRHLAEIRRGDEPLRRIQAAAAELSDAIDRLEDVAGGLRRGVMQIRMLPIGPLFHRFQRIVREMAQAGGKEIRLEIQGDKTELDKRMIDELADPLIHLIRNAADHGIEPPAVRQPAGKPRQGTITLDASQRGNRIFIRIADDGQGLDLRRIRARAVALGLVEAADAERLTPAQCETLIWRPGLSTVEKVTEVSGRGVGMDIIKAKIDELGGSVELESQPGQGTVVTIILPLTLAVLPSLLTEVGGDVYAFPLEAVTEITCLKPEDLSPVHQQRTACLRGRVISVLGLDEVFGPARGGASKVEGRASSVENGLSTFDPRPSTFDARPSTAELTLVIVGKQDGELGLAVDRVLGRQELVIKSLAENFHTVPGIAGAGILG
ncbi:MAG: chemotaxis protein CheA, partial [Pirellulales bacterium]|nr:chemotaxis protein CheA [Pirellulales bacterium]